MRRLKRDVEQPDNDEPANEHEQGLVAAIGQHLVDDHLEEQRRREGEDRHEQRHRQHMAERMAITPDGRAGPAHAERVRIDPAPPIRRAIRAPAADIARDVFERRLLDGVADRIDESAKPRRTSPATPSTAPLVMRTIAGVGNVRAARGSPGRPGAPSVRRACGANRDPLHWPGGTKRQPRASWAGSPPMR